MKTERQKLFAQRKKIDEERAELRAKLNEQFGEEINFVGTLVFCAIIFGFLVFMSLIFKLSI